MSQQQQQQHVKQPPPPPSADGDLNGHPNLNGRLKAEVAEPEVVPRAKRRQFTADYKRRILVEAEGCSEPGEIGALLRREELYSSHLTRWRQPQTEEGLKGLSPQKRGRKADPQAEELVRLQQENERLRTQLEQAELTMDVQKKLSQLLGLKVSQIGSEETL
jgi:transposase-like protein